jgi:hypothetical protein
MAKWCPDNVNAAYKGIGYPLQEAIPRKWDKDLPGIHSQKQEMNS